MSMTAAAAQNVGGPPDAKKFRFSLPTQVVVQQPLFGHRPDNHLESDGEHKPTEESGLEPFPLTPENQEEESEAGKPEDECNATATNSFDENESVGTARSEVGAFTEDLFKLADIKTPLNPLLPNLLPVTIAASLQMPGSQSSMIDFVALYNNLNNSLFAKSYNNVLKPASTQLCSNRSTPSRSTPLQKQTTPSPASLPVIPGALAVAASEDAKKFSEDDWSWHRNPQASLRSGGTNKQTPVWKYFVYNKLENLSRCIVGSCTYMLKGPHTSTLACHLKKHTAEYAEFQKLKSEYSRERNVGQGNVTPFSTTNNKNSSSASSSASSCASSSSVGGGLLQQGIFNNNLSQLHNGAKNGGMLGSPTSSSSSPYDTTFNGIFGIPSLAGLPPMTTTGSISYYNNNVATTPTSSLHKKTMQNGKATAFLSNIADVLTAKAAAAAAAAELKQESCSPESAEEELRGQSPNYQLAPACTPKSSTSNVFHSALNLAGSSVSSNSRKSVNSFCLNQTSRSILPSSPASTSISSVSQHSNQIIKKKQQQEHRQQQLEINLALSMATSKLPNTLLHNPFFRNLMERANIGFVLPAGSNQIDELISSLYSRAVDSVKKQISSASKFSLLIDVIRLDHPSVSVKKEEEGQSLRICVSAAFFSSLSQSMEVVLLGISNVDCMIETEDLGAMVQSVAEKVIEEYNFSMTNVSCILMQQYPSNEQSLGLNDTQILDKQLALFNKKVAQTFSSVFEKDHFVHSVKKSFYTMVLAFLASPNAVSELTVLTVKEVNLQISQSFEVLATTLLSIKEPFLLVCQKHVDSAQILTQEQWIVLSKIIQLSSLFQKYANWTSSNGNLLTVDQVVPALRQIKNSLDQDFSTLGDLPLNLWEDLCDSCASILDPENQSFDSTFVQATLLNPQLAARFLDESQINFAKQAVQRLVAEKLHKKHTKTSNTRKYSVESCSSLSTCEVKSEIVECSQEELFGRNLLAMNMVQKYFQDEVSVSAAMPANVITLFDPLKFWHLNKEKYEELSELAVELLSIPAGQVSLGRDENVLAKDECDWRKEVMQSLEAGNLDCAMVQRDAFLTFNRKFVTSDSWF